MGFRFIVQNERTDHFMDTWTPDAKIYYSMHCIFVHKIYFARIEVEILGV